MDLKTLVECFLMFKESMIKKHNVDVVDGENKDDKYSEENLHVENINGYTQKLFMAYILKTDGHINQNNPVIIAYKHMNYLIKTYNNNNIKVIDNYVLQSNLLDNKGQLDEVLEKVDKSNSKKGWSIWK